MGIRRTEQTDGTAYLRVYYSLFLLPENKLGGITHEQIKEFFATNQCKRYQA